MTVEAGSWWRWCQDDNDFYYIHVVEVREDHYVVERLFVEVCNNIDLVSKLTFHRWVEEGEWIRLPGTEIANKVLTVL